MKHIISIIISGALVVSGFGQTRNVLVGTNNAVVQPTNFWSADATNARTGLGLGSAATNPASAFQPSSATLSNLASNNAVNLTNLRATNIVGVIPSSNIPTVSLTNISGTLAITQGGTGATNAGGARTNLGLGETNSVTFSNIIVGSLSGVAGGFVGFDTGGQLTLRGTNLTASVPAFFGYDGFNVTAMSPSSSRLRLGFSTNLDSLWTAVNASNARDAVGLGLLALTNTNNANFRAAIGLGTTNDITNRTLVLPQADGLSTSTAYGIQWRSMYPSSNGLIALSGTDDQGQTTFRISTGTMSGTTAEVALFNASRITFYEPLEFNNTTNAATTRTNLGLGWAALTNTTTSGFNASLYGSNTNPVLVNTSGDVVSPTNFWQVAPISTTVQYQTNVTGASTNAATNSRNLFLFSLAPSVSGVTNTVTLPTNTTTTFEGDRATIVHLATNSANTITAIRQLGAATNIITLNQVDETVLLMYRGGQWRLADNLSFIEPIYFSGTNAAANAAASRVNLGLGTGDNVTFQNITISDQTLTLSHGVENDVFVKNESGNLEFGNEINGVYFKVEESTLSTRFDVPIYFGNTTNAATTRTNLDLGLPALTNTSNTTFQQAIFTTNAAPTNSANVNGIGFNTAIAWMAVNIVTNGVTNTFHVPLFK